MDDSQPIQSGMVSRAVEGAQKRVEGNNFDARKRLLQYDDVLRQQREIIYQERRQVLESENMRELVESMIQESIETNVAVHTQGDQNEWNLKAIEDYVQGNLLDEGVVTIAHLEGKSPEEMINLIFDEVQKK